MEVFQKKIVNYVTGKKQNLTVLKIGWQSVMYNLTRTNILT
jgi:hypothetical protein